MVVAGHVSPSATVVPHHHSAVLTRKEVAVGLPFVPVFIQLTVWNKIQKLEGDKNNNEGDFKMSNSHIELFSAHQRVPIRPAEVTLDSPVIQADPLVFPVFVSE